DTATDLAIRRGLALLDRGDPALLLIRRVVPFDGVIGPRLRPSRARAGGGWDPPATPFDSAALAVIALFLLFLRRRGLDPPGRVFVGEVIERSGMGSSWGRFVVCSSIELWSGMTMRAR